MSYKKQLKKRIKKIREGRKARGVSEDFTYMDDYYMDDYNFENPFYIPGMDYPTGGYGFDPYV